MMRLARRLVCRAGHSHEDGVQVHGRISARARRASACTDKTRTLDQEAQAVRRRVHQCIPDADMSSADELSEGAILVSLPHPSALPHPSGQMQAPE